MTAFNASEYDAVYTVEIYSDGFIIDDDPFRDIDDSEHNKEFVETIHNGLMPKMLKDRADSDKVEMRLWDYRYKPYKTIVKLYNDGFVINNEFFRDADKEENEEFLSKVREGEIPNLLLDRYKPAVIGDNIISFCRKHIDESFKDNESEKDMLTRFNAEYINDISPDDTSTGPTGIIMDKDAYLDEDGVTFICITLYYDGFVINRIEETLGEIIPFKDILVEENAECLESLKREETPTLLVDLFGTTQFNVQIHNRSNQSFKNPPPESYINCTADKYLDTPKDIIKTLVIAISKMNTEDKMKYIITDSWHGYMLAITLVAYNDIEMPLEVLRWLKEKLEEELDSCLTTKYPILGIKVNVGLDDNYLKSTIIKGWQNCRPEFRKMAIKYELGKITKRIQFHKEHAMQCKALSNAEKHNLCAN